MSDSIAISVKNVSKDFKLPHQKTSSIKDAFVRPIQALRGGRTVESQHALRNISFDIKQGEFFGIVGRNGSGKSTLLKILAKIYQPTSGEVNVKGQLVPFIELGVGFNPELTGRENVYLSGALNGFSEKEVDEMYDDIVRFAELEPFMDQKLKNYSSGMQVRLAFSVATRAEADILLIDEVLAVGDSDFQRKCFDYFKSLKKAKTTVVFVTHDMNAVREYCDRALLINKSEVVAVGQPDKIATKYTRLFTAVDYLDGQSDEGGRWGDGRATYTDVKCMKRLDNSTKSLEFSATLHANETVVKPIVGFTIKSPDGSAITGTNNSLLRKQIAIIDKGQEITVQWSIPAIFSNGLHEIDVSIVAEDGVTHIDWWEGAAKFRVDKENVTPYVVSPDISVSFNER